MKVSEPGADLLAENGCQRRRQGLDHRHPYAEFARGGSDLLADESGADDRQPGAWFQPLAQVAGVGESAQGMDVLETG